MNFQIGKEEIKKSADVDTQNLCKNITALRKMHNMSKKEFAKKLGVGVGSISKLENGVTTARINSDFLYAVYFEFNILPSKLFSPDAFK